METILYNNVYLKGYNVSEGDLKLYGRYKYWQKNNGV